MIMWLLARGSIKILFFDEIIMKNTDDIGILMYCFYVFMVIMV